MTSTSSNPADIPAEQRLIQMWNRLGNSAPGRKLFSYLLGRTVPYSGSIGSEVLDLQPGLVHVKMKDRRSVRNHLHSAHAIALANLGELASGLAMISAVPADTRTIVVKIEIEYHKKARGELVAEGRASPPFSVIEPINSLATAEIKDVEGDIVASVKVNWRLSPKEGAVVK